MKKIVIAILCLLIMGSMTGCQWATKNYGGSTTIYLEANQKLEEITWKDNALWYLTRPMTEDDVAETHTFQEQSNMGVFEGTVTIIESKE